MAPHRAAAAAVFAFGFGALAFGSVLGLGDPTLPGLASFRSATVGDGLLLPLMAYALALLASRQARLLALLARLGWQREPDLWTISCRDGHGRRSHLSVRVGLGWVRLA